jgi:hypothetical protein
MQPGLESVDRNESLVDQLGDGASSGRGVGRDKRGQNREPCRVEANPNSAAQLE